MVLTFAMSLSITLKARVTLGCTTHASGVYIQTKTALPELAIARESGVWVLYRCPCLTV